MRDRALTILAVAFVAMVSFTGTALAAGAVTPDDGSLFDLAKPVLDAVMNGHGWLAAAAALVFVTALARRYLPSVSPKFAWVGGDVGGTAAAILMSFGGALATTLAGGGAPSLEMVKMALIVAIGAAGGYTMLKKFAVPLLRAVQSRVPAWAKPIVGMLIWVCERPDVIGRAKAAGDAAVKAKPAPGVAGIAGAPREVK